MILQGDSLTNLRTLPDESVNCCVTSPPYWGLRNYGMDGQMGIEETPEAYVDGMVNLFREARRVLRKDGTLWLNLGDTFAATSTIRLKQKDLVGIPWRVALALQADGWYLRSDIIWHKPNPMPESVTDRPTRAHEYIFLLSKSKSYYYDHLAIKEPVSEGTLLRMAQNVEDQKGSARANGGVRSNRPMKAVGNTQTRNKRSVWTVTTKPFRGAHFATFPPDLIEPCILAGCPEGGVVLDPFFGAGTTGLVALQNNRKYIGIELNPEYISLASSRLEGVSK